MDFINFIINAWFYIFIIIPIAVMSLIMTFMTIVGVLHWIVTAPINYIKSKKGSM